MTSSKTEFLTASSISQPYHQLIDKYAQKFSQFKEQFQTDVTKQYQKFESKKKEYDNNLVILSSEANKILEQKKLLQEEITSQQKIISQEQQVLAKLQGQLQIERQMLQQIQVKHDKENVDIQTVTKYLEEERRNCDKFLKENIKPVQDQYRKYTGLSIQKPKTNYIKIVFDDMQQFCEIEYDPGLQMFCVRASSSDIDPTLVNELNTHKQMEIFVKKLRNQLAKAPNPSSVRAN